MKTYDEALEKMHGETPEARERAKDHALRGLDLSREVVENEKTSDLIWELVVAHGGTEDCRCENCQHAFALAMSAYLNGIRVGMEMEKCDPS
jgi:hypothetical protein